MLGHDEGKPGAEHGKQYTTEAASAGDSVVAAVHRIALRTVRGTGTLMLLLDRSEVVVAVGSLPHSGN